MITVIIPAYNSASLIKEAIDSILQQSYRDIELIIINDGSTDNTESIIRSFKDGRIKLVNNGSNQGIVYSLNKAVALAQGQYIARMDADDVSNIDRLSTQLDYLKSNNLDICGSWVRAFGSREKIIKYPETIVDVGFFTIFGSPMAHPTVFGLAHIFKKYKYRNVPAEDYDLWARMLMDGVNIGNVPKSLLEYRVHDEQLTTDLTDIIESSIVITKRYIQTYIKNESFRGKLDSFDSFMKGNYALKDIKPISKKLCLLAQDKNVSKTMQCRALGIVYSRASSYNIITLLSYINDIKFCGANIIKSVDLRLALLFIFSMKKDSKLVLFIKRSIKRI